MVFQVCSDLPVRHGFMTTGIIFICSNQLYPLISVCSTDFDLHFARQLGFVKNPFFDPRVFHCLDSTTSSLNFVVPLDLSWLQCSRITSKMNNSKLVLRWVLRRISCKLSYFSWMKWLHYFTSVPFQLSLSHYRPSVRVGERHSTFYWIISRSRVLKWLSYHYSF